MHGNRLTIRLTRPLGNFNARIAVAVCVLPTAVDADPEGVKPPVPTAAPYTITEYVPGDRVVIERNRFYHGSRPHRVARIVVDISLDPATAIDRVDRGSLDYAWVPTGDYARSCDGTPAEVRVQPEALLRRAGELSPVLRAQHEQRALQGQRASAPAVNFAIDRKALLRARGPLAGFLTDQYLPPGLPGFQDAHIYPLERPDLKTGSTARQRRHAEREGGALRALRTRSAARRPRSSRRTSRRSGSRSRSRRSRTRCTSRRSPRRASRSTSPGPDGSQIYPIPRCSTTSSRARTALTRTSRTSTRRRTTRGSTAHRGSWDRSATRRTEGSTSTSRATPRPRSRTPTTTRSHSSSKRVGCIVLNPYLDLAAACLK